jgi:hypothetical protein
MNITGTEEEVGVATFNPLARYEAKRSVAMVADWTTNNE